MTRALLATCALLLGCGSPALGPFGPGDAAAPAGSDLASAGCGRACAAPTPVCNASGHCVGCAGDHDCAAGTQCKITSDALATCVPGCADDSRCGGGRKCCGGRCVDPMTDPQNCGACASPCSSNHGAGSCAGGACHLGACDPGFGDCNQDPKDGCEANLHTDAMNCTACGMKCAIPNAVVACADGCYAAACTFGFDDCNADPKDGCETATKTDPMNCGACNTKCTNPPNASAVCQSSACVLSACNQGFADCNGDAKDGCEINLLTDKTHCGGCLTACGLGQVCMGGACTCPNCMNAFPNASANCANGQCLFAQCNLGFANCDNNVANGCEVSIANDAANCGQCGASCPNNLPFCGNGACQAMPLGCFRVADVQQMGPMKPQFTSCSAVANNGFTCMNPTVRYGNVGGGVPAMHGNNDFPAWCKQLGCKGYVANSVVYGNRSFAAPAGKLFWCASYDENDPHWCDWQDGAWYNMTLDYHAPSADAITSITCN